MPMRRAAALIGILALTALFGGWRIATAQTDAACRNDAAPIDRPAPDALPLAPNMTYTATWRLLNTGDCTWGEGYALTPIDAAALGNPSAAVTTPVAPGETLTVTLTLTAPVAPGYHQGVWRLTDPSAAAFGPWLPLEIDVAGAAANADAAVGDVALPEVLAMSGFGSIAVGDELFYYEDPCAATEDEPTLILGDIYFSGLTRERELHLCNVTPGSTVGVTLTAPTGDVFTRTLTVPVPVDFTDAGGNAYTRALVSVSATWLANAALGPWRVAAATPGGEIVTQFDLAPLSNPPRWLRRWLDNRPVATADPFAAAQGCHYAYAAGDPFYITGHGLPPAAPVRLGIYVTRLGAFYFMGDLEVVTDAAGSFRKLIPPDSDFAEPGQEYTVYLFEGLDPSSFFPDGISYDPFFTSGVPTPLSVCYTVRLAEDTPSLRLAFATGIVAAAEIGYLSPTTFWLAYVTQGLGACDAGAPAWAADGSLVYHTNCGDSYDLARHPDPSVLEALDTGGVTPAPLLTTSEFDETDPAVAADGRIVFRRAPAGTDLTAAGELWVLDPAATEDPVSLGIQGHAPAWSPDGTQIAYMADTDGSWQVYIYDLATAATQLVSVDCPGHCRCPAWSPDGSRIVYSATASADDLTPAALWLATPAAGTAQIWKTGAYDQPAWSATGWVIFTGPDGLYRARPDQPAAAPQRYLYNADAFYGDPAWSY